MTRSHNPTELHPVLPWQHIPVPFFRYHSKKPRNKTLKKQPSLNLPLLGNTHCNVNTQNGAKPALKHKKQREPELLLTVRQVGPCCFSATRSNVQGSTHVYISEPTCFFNYGNNACYIFPTFPPLISQGLTEPRGIFSLGAAKCQRLIMCFMPHPHYNSTKVKHCKPLKDHQLTLGLPTSLWISEREALGPEGGILITILLINGRISDFKISLSE